MRSNTQMIMLDRLQHALATRGVDMKRSAVLEIAAQAFGFLDGNAFVAAMKEERFAPPVAETVGTVDAGGTLLTILRDPTDGALQAVDRTRLDAEARRDRFVVSPYGRLLSLVDMPAADVPTRVASMAGVSPGHGGRDVRIVGDMLQDGGDAECRRYRHLLTDDTISIDKDPILYLSATRMAYVDDILHFLFDFEEQYDDHEQGVLAARSFAVFEADNAATFARLGGFIAWQDRLEHGRIEFQAFLPASLADHVDAPGDWHDAVAVLFGADHDGVTARFQPQTWVKDNAMDDDPLGEVDFDVTFEILLMGTETAGAMRDNREESDDLRNAALAPDWIRDWSGPGYVTVADEIAEYLERRSDPEPDDDGECDFCEQRIDYDTGICTGCGHDHNADGPANDIDPGILRAVLPDDAKRMLRQPDANDPV